MIFTTLIFTLLFHPSTQAADLGFRYQNGKCLNSQNQEGLNPSYFGQCSDMKGAYLGGMSLDNVDMSGSDFTGATLTNLHFNGSTLLGAKFFATSFDRVKISESILNESFFINSFFQQSSILFSHFKNTNFKMAQIKESVIEATDLSNANLESADLRKSTIAKDVIVAGVNWKNSLFDKATVLPFAVEQAIQLGMIKKGSWNQDQILVEMDKWVFVKVKLTGAMTDKNMLETCKSFELRVPCNDAPNGNFSDNACLDVGLRDGGYPMRTLARRICNVEDPSECALMDNLFQYMGQKWDDNYSSCGSVGQSWCAVGSQYKDLFAICVESIE